MEVNEILQRVQQKGGERFTASEALHLTTDGRAVPEGNMEGRFVFVPAGGDMPLGLAHDLGLTKCDKAEPKAVKPGADKAVKAASVENK